MDHLETGPQSSSFTHFVPHTALAADHPLNAEAKQLRHTSSIHHTSLSTTDHLPLWGSRGERPYSLPRGARARTQSDGGRSTTTITPGRLPLVSDRTDGVDFRGSVTPPPCKQVRGAHRTGFRGPRLYVLGDPPLHPSAPPRTRPGGLRLLRPRAAPLPATTTKPSTFRAGGDTSAAATQGPSRAVQVAAAAAVTP